MHLPTAVRASTRTPFLQVVKTSVAIVAAWFLGLALFPQQVPIFAAIAALLCVQPSVNQSVGRAIERSLGVIAGVLVAYLAGLVFGQASWLVILAIVVSMLLAWALPSEWSSTCSSCPRSSSPPHRAPFRGSPPSRLPHWTGSPRRSPHLRTRTGSRR